ncbi:MAG: PQQ-binding-like beta-propeller repeat protein [Planctomycetota bacterium]
MRTNVLGWVVLSVLVGSLAWADEWPQFMGPQRDGVWREDGILETFPAAGTKVLWRTPIGMGYAGPAVSGGRVYVADRKLATGAVFPASGFQKGEIRGTERVVCLNAADGKEVWKHEYDCPYNVQYSSGPRTTPVVSGGKVYTLGTEGNLFCLDAEKGTVIWSHEFKKELTVTSPIWGFAASPMIDGQKLICLARGNGSTVIAYDKDTGKELWRALTAQEPGYCPPVIYELNGKRQLIVWHPESVNGLNPETGEVYWTQKFQLRSGLSVPMPRALKFADGSDGLFVTAFYNGPMMLKFTTGTVQPAVLWRGESISEKKTDGLHSIMPTPYIDGGFIYGVCSYGQLRCLNAETGKRVWESFIATGGPYPNPEGVRWGNAFIIRNGDRVFLPNEKGDLIIAKLTPKGFEEMSRAHIIEPDNKSPGRQVVWSHPAFANRCVYARNDSEIVCISLAK